MVVLKGWMKICSQMWELEVAGSSRTTDSPTRSRTQSPPGSWISISADHLKDQQLKILNSWNNNNNKKNAFPYQNEANVEKSDGAGNFFLKDVWNYLGMSIKLSDRSGTALVWIWRFLMCFVTFGASEMQGRCFGCFVFLIAFTAEDMRATFL